MAHIVAVLTATLLTTAAVWFWNRCIAALDRPEARPPLDDPPEAREGTAPPDEPTDGNPEARPPLDDPPEAREGTAAPDEPTGVNLEARPPLDDPPETREGTAAPDAPPGVRWSWRSHRQSGLEFLRVTVTNPGPNPLNVTSVRLRTSDELARHDEPPAGLLDASDEAVELFGQDPGAAPLPRTLEPEGSADAYFPCRDVADWLYGVAESENLDRGECHLTPECVDGDGAGHLARRKIDYERWLMHGHGPSLREHADGQDPPSGGDDT